MLFNRSPTEDKERWGKQHFQIKQKLVESFGPIFPFEVFFNADRFGRILFHISSLPFEVDSAELRIGY